MYFYFIWKHCHSKVVIFPMPHEKKKREKKKNCVKTVKDYLFKTIIIFQTLHLSAPICYAKSRFHFSKYLIKVIGPRVKHQGLSRGSIWSKKCDERKSCNVA